MDDITARIDAWQSAGLIDADTAARLRAAESTEARPSAPAAPNDRPRRLRADRSRPTLGPTPTIAEMFAYLGAAFFIAAYSTFLARFGGDSPDRDAIMTAGSTIGTLALVVIGTLLAGRGDRARRGAAVLLLVAVSGAAVSANFLTQLLGWSWASGPELFIAATAVAVAVALRAALPAIPTQVGLLGSLTFLGAAVLDTVRRAIEGRLAGDPAGGGVSFDPYVPQVGNLAKDVLLPATGWLLMALGLGLLGLWETRGGTLGGAMRAALTRFWAGIVAIAGTWTGVGATGYLGGDSYGRILTPWIGDAILIVLVAVLVERALRRDSVAFIVPAAIGLIVALTDLNVTYLSDSTEVGLLIEGVILLAVGFAADRLRRRLGRGSTASLPAGEAVA